VQITELSALGLRVAILPLRRRETPMRFVLFPMVHFGRPEFYAEVTTRLRRCDLIVAEGADQASSNGLAYLLAMRATGQPGAERLVAQDIDYAALGVPTIWPDLEPDTRPRSPWLRAAGWLDVIIMTPVYTAMMAAGAEPWLARQKFEISDRTEARTRLFSRIMIEDRDRDLLKALQGVHEERKDEAIEVAVVYGAAHMPAVVRGLHARFGYRAVRGSEWLTAIDA
jgi:hypothetical protein